MNKALKSFGVIVLLCFSFYYTHQFALLMQKKDPIYQNILVLKEEVNLKSVDATIIGDYIIPGLKGKEVNIEKSFQKMKNQGVFGENYLVFDEVIPTITLNQNKDKIIKKGNNAKMAVSFILDENSNLINYFEEMGMDYSLLTTEENLNSNLKGERINIDKNNFNKVEKELSKLNKNNNICFIEKLDKDFCLKKKKILVEATFNINNNNLASVLNKVEAGSIYYLKNLDLSYLKLLIENIVYKGYSIVNLSQLISESRS